ncbi:MAG: class II aldolase/adducin family protein [Planctomycetota bacterium]|jgi:L-fuculose-phosphate aldolase
MTNVYRVKQEICRIGDRLYKKGFAAANDGNISYRVGDKEVICTPTMICKGFMRPDDLCTVDMEGNQLEGRRKRTSEVNLHLAIMKARPEVKAVVHCHPPHATAFGIAREPIPQCVLSEVEMYIGDVPITKYAIPGSQELVDAVLPFLDKTNVVILANHGTVTFDETLEMAYWRTEILDNYCRILMLARGLGRITYFTEPEARALLEIKRKWGFQDPRLEMENCDICANDVFRESWKATGVSPGAFEPPVFRGAAGSASAAPPHPPSADGSAAAAPEHEALVQAITDRVMSALDNDRK